MHPSSSSTGTVTSTIASDSEGRSTPVSIPNNTVAIVVGAIVVLIIIVLLTR